MFLSNMENIRNVSRFLIIAVLSIIFDVKIEVWTQEVQNYYVICK